MYNALNLATVLQHPEFDASKPTLIYFHGYRQTINGDGNVAMSTAYRLNGGYNFIEYDNLAEYYTFDVSFEFSRKFQFHIFLLKYVPYLGWSVATSIIPLMDAGLPSSKLELLGYSLGAEISGYVGRFLKSLSKKRYYTSRIVGLEPAIKAPVPLNWNDSPFVVTVHTGNKISMVSAVGHVNFWVNGGVTQPGCGNFYSSIL